MGSFTRPRFDSENEYRTKLGMTKQSSIERVVELPLLQNRQRPTKTISKTLPSGRFVQGASPVIIDL